MTVCLDVDFLEVTADSIIKEYEFLNNYGEIPNNGKTLKFNNIEEYFNESEEEIQQFCFTLYTKDKEKRLDFQIKLFKGYNHGYCFVGGKGDTYHLLFKGKEEVEIKYIKNTLKIFDNNNNTNRKRLLLINFYYSDLFINKGRLSLPEFIPRKDNAEDEEINENFYSFEYSFYSIKKRVVLSKFVKEKYKKEKLYEDIFQEYNTKLEKFINNLLSVKEKVDKEEPYKNYTKEIEELHKDNSIGAIPLVFLNKSKDTLKKELDKKDYIKFAYNKLIYYLFTASYAKTKDTPQNLIKLIKKINLYYQTIDKDQNLQNYQKILLIEQIESLYNRVNSFNNFLKNDFNYYVVNKSEDKSILFYVKQFFIDLKERLTENSLIFWRFVEINGEKGFYKNNEYFCYDMKNIKQIKIILQQFEPDIITTFKFDKSTCAMINKVIGIPFINVNSIQNIEKYFLDKKLDDFEIVEGKNIAVKITNYLMHEDYGHKNFSYKMRSESPCRFIHSNIAYKLEEARSTSKESNIIKILPDNQKSDSITFFELIYGRIGDYYTYEILDQFDKYGKLIDRVDLWVGDFTTFNKFIKYKYFFYKKNIAVAGYENLTIEKEIDLMKDKALKENLDVDTFYKKIKTVYEKNKKKKIKEDLETGLKKNIIKDNKEKEENEKKEKEKEEKS